MRDALGLGRLATRFRKCSPAFVRAATCKCTWRLRCAPSSCPSLQLSAAQPNTTSHNTAHPICMSACHRRDGPGKHSSPPPDGPTNTSSHTSHDTRVTFRVSRLAALVWRAVSPVPSLRPQRRTLRSDLEKKKKNKALVEQIKGSRAGRTAHHIALCVRRAFCCAPLFGEPVTQAGNDATHSGEHQKTLCTVSAA